MMLLEVGSVADWVMAAAAIAASVFAWLSWVRSGKANQHADSANVTAREAADAAKRSADAAEACAPPMQPKGPTSARCFARRSSTTSTGR